MDVRPFIVGNWKMNGMRASLAEARAIDRVASRFLKVEVGLAPPFTLVHATRDAVESIRVGAQDCHFEETGAFTGDISPSMLADAGADFVIVGHSERREYHVESDEWVRRKCEAARSAGLGVILCVGESETVRDCGRAVEFVTEQLTASAPQIENAAEKLSIAYEPIWAIGTGRVPSVEDISEMHEAIAAKLSELYGEASQGIRILYGGSVNAENAAELLSANKVGGALVGGASLSNESFGAIIMAAAGLGE
ncbi:triose-phosphate isomerase [Altererythrobacter sp. CAU 1778]